MSKTLIDMQSYPRRSHYEFFRHMAYPYVGLTANVDVTRLLKAARERSGSTFLACLYVLSHAANGVPELRQRIVGEDIVEFDHCCTAHTVALPDHTFCNCKTDDRMSFERFLAEGKRLQEQAKQHHGFVGTQEDETDLIFVSCVPWVSFTQVIQPAPIPADCNPRIVLGKYIQEGERTLMPLSIQANHALVDGWHLSEFYRLFDQLQNEVCG